MAAVNFKNEMINFVIEKLCLCDDDGRASWVDAPLPQRVCEERGIDAGAVLAGVVARDGAMPLGATASFKNGEVVMLAQKGESLYALRAIPG